MKDAMLIVGVQADILEYGVVHADLISVVGHLGLNQLRHHYESSGFRSRYNLPEAPFDGTSHECPRVVPLRGVAGAKEIMFLSDEGRELSDEQLEIALRTTLDYADERGFRRVAFSGARPPQGVEGYQARVEWTKKCARTWTEAHAQSCIEQLSLVSLTDGYVRFV